MTRPGRFGERLHQALFPLRQRIQGDALPSNPEDLIHQAREKTGLTNLGDPLYMEGFHHLYQGFVEPGILSPTGRYFAGRILRGHLRNRLLIEEAFSVHPEIARENIEKPIFITGLPRAGSTFLQRLLASDERLRPLRFEEGNMPAPPPGIYPDQQRHRTRDAETFLRDLKICSPELWAKHSMAPEDPEECWLLMRNAFMHNNFSLIAQIPEYLRWLSAQDMSIAYRDHRRQLQLLQAQRPAKRWILKAPSHVKCWQSLLEIYPDATFLITHRTPLEVIPSITSLVTTIRDTYNATPQQPLKRIRVSLNSIRQSTLKIRELSDNVPPEQVVHVRYPDLVSDPLGTADRIMTQLGMSFSETTRKALGDHTRKNPQGRHGRHSYALPPGGVTEEEIRADFADYMATYDL